MHGSMQNGAPVINQAHRGGTLRLAFLSAVVSLVVSFAAAAAPIPLYNIYRAEDGFTNFGISTAIVTYSVGTMAGLLVLGRLSNHLGRRLTAIASLGLLLLGCLLLLNVHNIGTLLAGRVLMGVGTGLASSTLTSYIVDAAPARPEWLTSVASSQGPMLGLTVGAIASGALVQFGLLATRPHLPGLRRLLISVCRAHRHQPGNCNSDAGRLAITATQGQRTGPGQASAPSRGCGVPGHLGDRSPLPSLRACACRRSTPHPQPAHPRTGVRRLYGPQRSRRSHRRPVHIRGSPTRRHDQLPGRNDRHHHSDQRRHTGVVHHRDHSRRRRPRRRHQRCHPWLLHGSTLADRAPIFSAIYLVCYSVATFPSLISGKLSNTFSLPQIAFGYGVLALGATLFTVLGARNPHTDATGNGTCDSSSTLDDAAAFNPTERRAGKTNGHGGAAPGCWPMSSRGANSST